MAKKKPAAATTPVDIIKHHDSRKNIPTEELRDFLDEPLPKTLLYPRDTTLDPQLVWKGKDEQDRAPLEVPVLPIYIQEKIHPQALIEDFQERHGRDARATGGLGVPPKRQLDLFADFNGLDGFDKKIDFYQHNQHWSNRMILGDSLAVMTSLAEKEGLRGQVQTIYIDPPYGIKFGSNWQVSTRKRDVKDGSATDATRQPEQVRAFRDTWELGIHSYLAYLRDRLTVARELLTESGSVFVQIGDENVHLVRAVMDEVFGSENFIAIVVASTTTSASSTFLDGISDFVLWYSFNKRLCKYRPLFLEKEKTATGLDLYTWIRMPDGTDRRMTDDEIGDTSILPKAARIFRVDQLTSQTNATTTRYDVLFRGKTYECGKRQWATPRSGMDKLMLSGRVCISGSSLAYVRFLDDYAVIPLRNMWNDTGTGSFTDPKRYVVQTNIKVIQRCLLMTTDPGDLVLDPTCGSGTTAYVAEQWGRRWITVDTSRVALALARTRLMTAKFPYYLLADSAEGRKKEGELTGQSGSMGWADTGGTPVPRGMGVPPMSAVTASSPAAKELSSQRHGQDARATGVPPVSDNPVILPGRGNDTHVEIQVRQGAYLPHWTCAGGIYAVTFRLADALPRPVYEAWLRERDDILQRASAAKRPLTPVECQRLRDLHSEKVEKALDAGHGACHLRDERIGKLVYEALHHFDGDRYDLVAACVMPNHVHVVVHPRPGHDLSDIYHAWKSFTAKAANKLLGLTGTFWQPEPYDHLLRDGEDFEHAVEYALRNPENAKLPNWPWVGRGKGYDVVVCALRGMGVPPMPSAVSSGIKSQRHGQDARATSGMGVPPMSSATPSTPEIQSLKHGRDARATGEDIRKGFVYKRVPHVTLKSIANNPEIKEGLTRAQIDAAIARHADTETLFDKPYEDKARLRVTGPFTFESLSPHRRLTVAKTKERNQRLSVREYGAGDFGTMIIENLKKAGIQSRNKQDRLKFDTLEPYAGEWVHAAGTYTDAHGQERRVAVCIGPEHGTVGPDLVKEAAKEAIKGVGFDMLYICGFSFDPHVDEETKRYGKLNVQICRMNPDLSMGDELLKKTGAGNLFTVFGEPDILIRTVAGMVIHGGMGVPPMSEKPKNTGGTPVPRADDLVVEIRGVDVYDPTTGEVRSQTTDDIACWFIDTNYDGESFFVRLAYFTGAGDPYDKLKRALKAEIDEAAWSELYQTTSQPFPRPVPKVKGKTPQIAVKVINHYGDEVLKVYSVK